MMDRPHDIWSGEPVALLQRLGVAALPDTSASARAHVARLTAPQVVGAVKVAPVSTRGSRVPRARMLVAAALVALIALPSLALAGSLPAPMQRAIASAAATVGIDVPAPRGERSSPARPRNDSGASNRAVATNGEKAADVRRDARRTGAARADAAASNGQGRGARGQRGHRYGQVADGPDQGKAGDQPRPGANASGGGRPAGSGRPASGGNGSAKPSRPTQPAPATTPAPPAPSGGNEASQPSSGSNAGGSGAGGNGGGRPAGD